MSEFPFPSGHYIGPPTRSGYSHSEGDAVDQLRTFLGIDGVGPIGQDDIEAIRAWHVAHGHQPLMVVREKDWKMMSNEASSAPAVASFSGSVDMSSDSAIGELPVEEVDYEQMGYRDLQAEARERGLPSGGTTEELIERLRA
jgi:hypothetical protein